MKSSKRHPCQAFWKVIKKITPKEFTAKLDPVADGGRETPGRSQGYTVYVNMKRVWSGDAHCKWDAKIQAAKHLESKGRK